MLSPPDKLLSDHPAERKAEDIQLFRPRAPQISTLSFVIATTVDGVSPVELKPSRGGGLHRLVGRGAFHHSVPYLSNKGGIFMPPGV
jgi:hypothetical protein